MIPFEECLHLLRLQIERDCPLKDVSGRVDLKFGTRFHDLVVFIICVNAVLCSKYWRLVVGQVFSLTCCVLKIKGHAQALVEL